MTQQQVPRPTDTTFSSDWVTELRNPELPTVIPSLSHIHQSRSTSVTTSSFLAFLWLKGELKSDAIFLPVPISLHPKVFFFFFLVCFALLFFLSSKIAGEIVYFKLQVWIDQNYMWVFQIWGIIKKCQCSILTFWECTLKNIFCFENTTTS